MEALVACRECGSAISPGAPFGHCPKCLIALGFLTEPSPTQQHRASERRIGDYELLDQIGRGGMGAVYRARQVSLKREVALKMILPGDTTRPEAIKRFQIEAEASAKLQHPNIVPTYEIGHQAGQYYFSMQLIDGTNLNQCLFRFQFPSASSIASKAQARHAQEKIARLICKIAVAVQFAHERGILHRDLKPQNILISQSSEPFLTDFGLAKILDQEKSVTESGAILGTLNYMAPEQAVGGRVSCAADIFSLGAILYELLTGQPPFRCATLAETLRFLAEQEPVDPRLINKWIDPDLAVISVKCLQKNPQERYATAAGLAEDIERWMRNEPIQARPTSRAVRVNRWVRRNRAVTALLVAMVIGLGTTLVFLSTTIQQSRARRQAEATLRIAMSDTLGQMSLGGSRWEIRSEALATFTGRQASVVPGAHMRLTLGVHVHQNHAGTVGQYAGLVDYLEKMLTQELRTPVRLNLRLYETMTVEALCGDNTDFVRISPLLYVEARSRGHMVRPVVRPLNSALPCVIITRSGPMLRDVNLEGAARQRNPIITPSGTIPRSLTDLRGHSLIFGEEFSAVTFWGKVWLAESGVLARDLSACDYIQPERTGEFIHGGYFSRNSDPLKMVVNGRYDAAVALEAQLEHSQYRTNLVVLKRFQCMDHFWIAASNAPNYLVSAFQHAMQSLHDSRVLLGLPDRPVSPSGFIQALESDYEDMERVRATAARFDAPRGEPSRLPPSVPQNGEKGPVAYEK